MKLTKTFDLIAKNIMDFLIRRENLNEFFHNFHLRRTFSTMLVELKETVEIFYPRFLHVSLPLHLWS